MFRLKPADRRDGHVVNLLSEVVLHHGMDMWHRFPWESVDMWEEMSDLLCLGSVAWVSF